MKCRRPSPLVDDGGTQPARGRVECNPGAGDATADHDDIETVGEELLRHRVALARPDGAHGTSSL